MHTFCKRSRETFLKVDFMLLNIISGLQHWANQVQQIVFNKMHHLSPQDYCIMLVLAISVGYCLLKGQNI